MNYSQHKPASCKDCTLYEAPGPVWGSGDPLHAKIGYCAQNPGKDEVAANPMEPLVGAAGRILNRQLFEAGVPRKDVFLTNIVKCKTPDNRIPTSHEVACCKPLLQKELDLVKADTWVLAGDLALKTILGNYSSIDPNYHPQSGIFQRMGCVERRYGKKWIATIHPAAFFRSLPPELNDDPIEHLRKAYTISGIALKEININENPTDTDLVNLVDYVCLHSREFADDVETVGLDNVEEDDYIGGDYLVTMCGVGSKPYEALIASPSQMPILTPIFLDSGIQRYEHNGPHDDYYIQKACSKLDYLDWLDYAKAKRFDTMLGTHYLKSIAPKKLKPYVVSHYTLLPYYQGFASKKDNLGSVRMKLYNGMDVITTFLAAKEMKRRLHADKLDELIERFGFPLLPIYEEWRREGVKVDLRKAALYKRIIEERIQKAATALEKLCGPLFVYTNHFHIKSMLYDRFGLPKQYQKDHKTKEDKLTSNFEARKTLRRWIEASPERGEQYKTALTFIYLIDFISGESKKLEYIGRISADGRIHAYYKAHGTMVFRTSSSPNLQNFPVYSVMDWGGARNDDSDDDNMPIEEEKGSGEIGSLRSMIVPDDPDGWIMTCDFAQLQLYIYAAIANVKWLKEIFQSGQYIYGVVYEEVYKPDKFFKPGGGRTKKDKLGDVPEQRIRRAKAVPLGFLFGRSAEAVAAEYGSISEARRLRTWWFDKCPELIASYNDTKYEMTQKKRIRHKFGQLIYYPQQKLTTAINNKAQSNEAFIVNESIILINNELKRRGLRRKGHRLMLSVHDSISINIAGPYINDAVEIYEDIVQPNLKRLIPELDNLQLSHSAEMSKQWDWNVIDYWKWKSIHINGDVSATHTHAGPTSPAGHSSLGGEATFQRLADIPHSVAVDKELST